MNIVFQRVSGNLLIEDQRAIVVLDDSASSVQLCLGLLEEESNSVILPESLLDDWGHEIASERIYHWMWENGDQFPRAEIFGQDLLGKPIQRFLREIDLIAKFPCLAHAHDQGVPSKWLRVGAIIIRESKGKDLHKIRQPAGIDFPLSHADVAWWQSYELPSDLFKILV